MWHWRAWTPARVVESGMCACIFLAQVGGGVHMAHLLSHDTLWRLEHKWRSMGFSTRLISGSYSDGDGCSKKKLYPLMCIPVPVQGHASSSTPLTSTSIANQCERFPVLVSQKSKHWPKCFIDRTAEWLADSDNSGRLLEKWTVPLILFLWKFTVFIHIGGCLASPHHWLVFMVYPPFYLTPTSLNLHFTIFF